MPNAQTMPADALMLLTGIGYALLVLAVVWGLLHTFLGYVSLRVNLVLNGIGGGVLLGIVLVAWQRSEPSGADYAIVCTALGVVLGVVGWLLWRPILALTTMAVVTNAAIVAAMLVRGGDVSLWLWFLTGLLGLFAGIGVLIYTRIIVILGTAIVGAFGTVLALTLLIVGLATSPGRAMEVMRSQLWIPITALVVFMALAFAGVQVQRRLARSFGSIYMPAGGAGGKKSGKSIKRGRRHPRFTRI